MKKWSSLSPRTKIKIGACLLFAGLLMSSLLVGRAWCNEAIQNVAMKSDNLKWAFISAAISTGLATLGAGIAVGLVGSAAIGILGERPEMVGRALIFVGLAEGIAIYGLIIAIMILGMV